MSRSDKKHRKLVYATDGVAYQLSDSGCIAASEYLGKPSRCFNCPFTDCLIDCGEIKRPYRNTIKELAKK